MVLFFKSVGNFANFTAVIAVACSVSVSAAMAQPPKGSADQTACANERDPRLPYAPTCDAELRLHRAMGEWLEENMPAAIAANTDYAGAQLTQARFVGQSLPHRNFSDAKLDWANFTGADLTGSSFANADLSSTIFRNANLTNVDFTGANMHGTHIEGADLTGARLSRVQNIATIFMDEATIYCRTIGYNDEVFSYSCPP